MTGTKKNSRGGDDEAGLANTSLGSSRRPAGSTNQDNSAAQSRRSDPPPAPSTKSPDQQMPKR